MKAKSHGLRLWLWVRFSGKSKSTIWSIVDLIWSFCGELPELHTFFEFSFLNIIFPGRIRKLIEHIWTTEHCEVTHGFTHLPNDLCTVFWVPSELWTNKLHSQKVTSRCEFYLNNYLSCVMNTVSILQSDYPKGLRVIVRERLKSIQEWSLLGCRCVFVQTLSVDCPIWTYKSSLPFVDGCPTLSLAHRYSSVVWYIGELFPTCCNRFYQC